MTKSCRQSVGEQFLAHLDARKRAQLSSAPQRLELVEIALVRAETAWPELTLSRERLFPYLASRLPDGDQMGAALGKWYTDDLYLCCACMAGDERARELFYRQYVPILRATLRRLRLDDDLVQDLEQTLVEQLLIGAGGKDPLLARYSGIGRLGSWLRVVAARNARKTLDRQRKQVPTDDGLLAARLPEDADVDQSLQLIKQVYRPAFKAALKEALNALGPREANLLRYRFVDELGLERIAAIYRVHNSTVHRWVEKARLELLRATQVALSQRLAVDRSECQTLIRLFQDNFDITLCTFMGDRGPEIGTP